MAAVLKQFQEEVAKVEKLQIASTKGRKSEMKKEEPKNVKPPTLPQFSGNDQTPKDEANSEQWYWQACKAMKSHTEGTVHRGIIQTVWGEVREFVSSIGFETSVEDILDKIEDQFGECWMVDYLKQDFYKMEQDKTVHWKTGSEM